MKSGFVNIFGKPNAGKSTLLNALLGEKLAIVSSKVQTTRHRIKGFLSKPNEYQIVFSDTPGIIESKYKLHDKMMWAVKNALEDADIALLIVDVNDNLDEVNDMFEGLKLKVPCLLILNKIDQAQNGKIALAEEFFATKKYVNKLVKVSALHQHHLKKIIHCILELLPQGQPFYSEDDLSDLPTRFFVSELIREKIYELFGDEIPYHSAVLINEFKDGEDIVRIQADIIVQRETQKVIVIGTGGRMIKQIGTLARLDIEKFIEKKVFLQLFVKVKPKWRDSEMQLKEYGY
jgi:GTPase